MKKFFKKDEDLDLLSYENNKNIKENEFKKEKKMSKNNVTILTPDVEIKGTIKFNNVLEMNGKFEGDLITKDGEVIVGETGEVKANLKGKNATIEGKVEGNVTASEKIELKNKAQLTGDLTAKTLSIEEGVLFVGKCNVNPSGIDMENAQKKETKK
ncbi:MAG: polymer-forming cytoskeletal protein [Victivallales bacterium]|nr:polymer-forming cytoskeletal protein [Victivallales bacterium]